MSSYLNMIGLITMSTTLLNIRKQSLLGNWIINLIANCGSEIEGVVRMDRWRSKYEPLQKYLKSENRKHIVMTFQEVEEVLGFKLPDSAYKYMAWWDESSQHTQAYSWTGAGYRSKPSLKEKKVEFISNNIE